MVETYYEFLKENITKYPDYFDKCIVYLPDLFQLFADLLAKNSVDEGERMIINSAIAYLVVPNDIIPENQYGSWGYMDDIFVCCKVIEFLKKKHYTEMKLLWKNEHDFDEVVNSSRTESERFLSENNMKDKILNFAGLE